MDNTKVKRVRKAKVPKVEEPIEETVYEPVVEEKPWNQSLIKLL